MILAQKTAIVTGATRGIGLAIADIFARQGAFTILIGRDHSRVSSVQNKFVATYGEGHVGVVLDVSKKEEIDKVVKELTSSRPIDILVNSAGVCHDQLVTRLDDALVQEDINTNLLGSIRMCQHVAKSMIRRRQGGCIINISSVVGLCGNVGQSVYSASKAGVIGFTKSLAKELGPAQIRVNAIAPGWIETDMTADVLAPPEKRKSLLQSIPLKRFGSPSDVADAALYIATSNYVHGQVLRVDGGITL